MSFCLKGIALTVLYLIFHKIISSKLKTGKYHRGAAARGCLPAPSNNLLGTSRLSESIKERKKIEVLNMAYPP